MQQSPSTHSVARLRCTEPQADDLSHARKAKRGRARGLGYEINVYADKKRKRYYMHMHPSTMDGCECVPVVTTTGCSSWRSEWCGGDGGSGSGRLPGLARYSTRCSAAALVRTGFSCFRFFIFVRRWPLRPNSCCLLFFPVTIPSRISCRILYGPLVMMVVDSDSLHYYFILQSSLLLYTTHSAPIKIAIYCCHTNAIISLFTYHTYMHTRRRRLRSVINVHIVICLFFFAARREICMQ